MSQDDLKKQDAPLTDLPAWLPEEMIPLYEWYRKHGGNLLTLVTVVAVVAAGTLYYLRHHQTRAVEASAAIGAAESIESLETLAGKYGSTRTGPLIRIRLAKAYYDTGKTAEALAAYDAFLRQSPRHALADIARMGRAAALEAEQKTDDALQAYTEFQATRADHYLYPSAVMGQARCLAAKGNKAEAMDLLDRLTIARAGSPWEGMARDLRGVIERFEGFKTRSLFDQLGDAARELEAAQTNADLLAILPDTAPDTATTNGAAVP